MSRRQEARSHAAAAWRQAQAMARAHGEKDWHKAAVAQAQLADALGRLVQDPMPWQPPVDIDEAAS